MRGEDYQAYLRQTEERLATLRSEWLGQETPLLELLPPYLRSAAEAEQARHLAEQLLFALALLSPRSGVAELRRAGRWLREAIFYLLTQTPPQDHILRQVLRLLRLEASLRLLLFAEEEPAFHTIRSEDAPPTIFQHWDAAVLQILDSCKRLDNLKERREAP